ncbi:hypothetical protein Y1Q_0008643 [Alligator mississippiensis]|uniref:Uncharacterized protein n=1 Tax=Alligator mississippiensis TaxID=8496 RepID=A0A151N9D4_ALLMI|nr:hypothetical protein Y1Q_0008643 [Alligator mississippiensis]
MSKRPSGKLEGLSPSGLHRVGIHQNLIELQISHPSFQCFFPTEQRLVLVSLFWLGLLSCSIRQINTKSSQYTTEMEDFDNYTYFYDNYEEDEQFQSHLSVSHMVSLSLCSVAFLLGVPASNIQKPMVWKI